MPQLPLPPLLGGVPIDAGDIPVGSLTDVQNEWARDIMLPETAPVRDAIIAGQEAACLQVQRQARYAAAQSDPLRATGEYLDEIGDEKGIERRQGESDTSYTARVNARPLVADPNDIIAAANAVLAPYTNISCRYAERSDGWFLNSGDQAWSSHIFFGDFVSAYDNSLHTVPNYPDRLYPDATALTPLPNRRPPGAMLNGDSYGRWFLLRAPDVHLVDSTVVDMDFNVYDLWQPTTAYIFGAYVQGFNTSSVPNGFYYECTTPGTTLGASPLFPTTPGSTVTDGTVVWTCVGAMPAQQPLNPGASTVPIGGFYVSAGGGAGNNASYLFNFSSTTDQIYAAVVGAVETVRGHSVRWTLFVDPILTA